MHIISLVEVLHSLSLLASFFSNVGQVSNDMHTLSCVVLLPLHFFSVTLISFFFKELVFRPLLHNSTHTLSHIRAVSSGKQPVFACV